VAPRAILRANFKYQSPLLEERAICGPERIARIVNVRRFGRCAVELDDFKLSTRAKILFVFIPNIEPAKVKLRQTASNPVDRELELVTPEVMTVAKYAALGVIAGFD
jgi:hypothetical protein